MMRRAGSRPDLAERNRRTKRLYPQGFDTASRVYVIWRGMKARCYDSGNASFSRYGGAGITVCAEWLDFSQFSAWATASGYSSGKTLDRIDSSQGYSPDNCRWASHKEQTRGRSNTKFGTAFGETKALGAWVEDSRCVVPYYRVLQRVTAGWELERALVTPARRLSQEWRLGVL